MAAIDEVRAIVLEALKAVNEQRPAASRFASSDDTLLYGAGGVLDSLDLVNLVIELEQRLEEQLGHYACEIQSQPAARLLDEPLRLSALASAAAVAEEAMPEREPHPRAFEGFAGLVEGLLAAPGLTDWAARYVRWELDLLAELGFGLDLGACAVSGATTGLAFVSPASGRAVSEAAAGIWRERLLPLGAAVSLAALLAMAGCLQWTRGRLPRRPLA